MASAVNRFKREGEIKRERGGDLLDAGSGGGDGSGWAEGEETAQGMGGEAAWSGGGAGPGRRRSSTYGGSYDEDGKNIRRGSLMQPIGTSARPQQGGKGAKGIVRPPGWVPPPDLEEKTAAYERAQQARVNWRRAIGAAKCITRLRRIPKDFDDDDAQFEFHYEETYAEVEDALTGEKKVLPIVRTELVDSLTGKLKAVAASNFNAGREREQRDELKGTPSGPGVSNLLFSVQKRPDNDPKDVAAALERVKKEKEAEKSQENLQQAQLLKMQLQMQMQQQGGPGGGGSGGGGSTFVTAAQFKEAERQKKLAKEQAEVAEAKRLEEEEKNFS